MAGNSELMDVIRRNVDNHHAKLSDALFRKWLQLQEENKIGEKETAFHLSTVIDLKTAIVDYFEESNLGLSWRSTSEEDQNGICSVLLMDFLIELSLTLHKNFKPERWPPFPPSNYRFAQKKLFEIEAPNIDKVC